MPTATKQVREEFLSSLHDTLASIFQGAQTSNASHKRRIKTLCKLHTEAATHVENKPGRRGGDDGSILLVGEKAFNRAFWQIVLCVLEVKRGVVEADRSVRLIGGFVAALMEQQDAKADEDEDEEDTPADRFLRKLISHLIPGCSAKDKTPRFRCTQTLSEILRNVPTLEDELYVQAKQVLLERGMDKEWTIRSAACIGLGVLARGEAAADDEEDEESDEEGESSGSGTTIMDKLKALCRFDMHPHVRIACLPGMSLPLNPDTLPLLLSRTRDTDPSVRRMSFRLLQQVPVRGLSVAQRSVIVRNGLGDRETAVRAEASKLVYQWAVACSDYNTEPNGGQSKTQARQKLDVKIDLDEFIDLFDLWDGEVAEEALKALIYRRPNVLEGLDLSQSSFWSNFTPSKALLARVFTELVTSSTPSNPYGSLLNASSSFAINASSNLSKVSDGKSAVLGLDFSKYSDSLPVLTLQAFNVQGLFNLLFQSAQTLRSAEEEDMPNIPGADKEEMEDQLDDCIFSLGQLLKMTRSLIDNMDGDEMGKRKMRQLVNDLLVHPYFPSTLLTETLMLLLKVSNNTLEFIDATIKPIINDLIKEERLKDKSLSRRYTLQAKKRAREEADEDDAQSTARTDDDSEEEEVEEEETKMRTMLLRLSVVNEALEGLDWPKTEYETLRLLQKHLVRPALAIYQSCPDASEDVKSEIFDGALRCLGLISVCDKTLALSALGFGIRGSLGAIPPQHVAKILECIVDIAMSHAGTAELTFGEVVKDAPAEITESPFLPVLLIKWLQSDHPMIQSTAVVGVCKLFLCGMWYNDELLEALILLYFLPDTAKNYRLRQCLSYFFPAFCYSSAINQARFSKVIIGAFMKLFPVYEELKQERDTEQEDMTFLQPERVITMLLDYSNPANLVKDAAGLHGALGHEDLHVSLAFQMLDRISVLLENQDDDDPAWCCLPLLCQALYRLVFPQNITQSALQKLLDSVSDILTNNTPKDKPTFKHLTNFEGKLRKLRFNKTSLDAERGEEEHGKTSNTLIDTATGTKRKRELRSDNEAMGSEERAMKKRSSLKAGNNVDNNRNKETTSRSHNSTTRPSIPRDSSTPPAEHDQNSHGRKEKAR
ncbi:hypothetical protein CPB86DRAFT_713554 [Serendipita vermifera]|nr:hypothetical protein CPB86DRAFT_713554 [Serendipita vermifera]